MSLIDINDVNNQYHEELLKNQEAEILLKMLF